MNWDDLSSFILVSKTKNITEAARMMQVSAATVARKIASLEEAMGVGLFEKTTTGYYLTEAGEKLTPLALEVESKIALMRRQLSAPEDFMAGRVSIDCPELMGAHLILPALASFHEEYGDISIDFSNTVKSSMLSQSQSDILIRLHKPDQGNFTMRKIGDLSQALYCSESYEQKYGVPASPEELRTHRLIGFSSELGYLPLAQWLSSFNQTLTPWIRAQNLGAQLQATLNGLGICVLPRFAARTYGLKQVLSHLPPHMSEIWLLRSQSTRDLVRVDVVADFLKSTIEANKELLL
ncbi:LysR family transcriptional regulator [Tateyamaria omphalii]|uniref:LysR family transcriptional regulator n=1 Tax=Tateyamaria omphalii TaxID=299262 RepID=UPI001C9A10F9|nr:LysR family transcriptional regulator [Tateyamaria omphalii]MBY5935076.1 LysR family transcriptional regulator [Tateyamaria omphalii]